MNKVTCCKDCTERHENCWTKAKYKLIEVLGGYTFPPVSPEIKTEQVSTVNVSASLMVNKDRYEKEQDYRTYIKAELVRILASHIFDEGMVSHESVIEFNDLESVVKVSAELVKGRNADDR